MFSGHESQFRVIIWWQLTHELCSSQLFSRVTFIFSRRMYRRQLSTVGKLIFFLPNVCLFARAVNAFRANKKPLFSFCTLKILSWGWVSVLRWSIGLQQRSPFHQLNLIRLKDRSASISANLFVNRADFQAELRRQHRWKLEPARRSFQFLLTFIFGASAFRYWHFLHNPKNEFYKNQNTRCYSLFFFFVSV